jgi:preprotein translocase subunit SecD
MHSSANHEKARRETPGRIHIILTVAIVAVGFLLCGERLNAEDGNDLLLTLQVKSGQPVSVVMDAIRKRAAALGAFSGDVVEVDPKTVSVRLPGYSDDMKKAVRIMENQALLEFKLVDRKADVGAAEKGDIPPGDEILYQMERNPKTGRMSRKAYVVKKQSLTGVSAGGINKMGYSL